MAKAYSKTPYEIIAVPYADFDFNRAVFLFGTRVENLLEEKEEVQEGKKTVYKRKYTLQQAIEEATRIKEKRKFAGYEQLFAGL